MGGVEKFEVNDSGNNFVLLPQSNDAGTLSLAEVDDKTFEDDDWNVIVLKCSSLVDKWEQLSAFLGLSSTLISTIRASHPGDLSCCWNEALSQWIKQNYNAEKLGKPSWKTLLGAIAHVDRRLFKKLVSEHKRHDPIVDCVLPFASGQVRVDEDNKDLEKDSSKEQEESCPGASKIMARPNILDDCTVGECHFTFPCLDVKELTKEKQKELHQRLYIESVEMMKKFQNLFSEVTKSLKERAISKSSILCHLVGLGQLKPVYEDPPLPVFRCQLHELRRARDIDDIMLVIGDYCSFFNFQVIEQIVEKLGTDHDKENLSKYRKDFNKYAMRKVFECPSEVSSTNEEGLIKLYITLDETYDNCTVSHLQLFIGKLKMILNIPSMLILHRIESGSLKLTLLLFYDQYCQLTFPLSNGQREALLCEGVVYFSCEGYSLKSLRWKDTCKTARESELLEYPKQIELHKLNSEYLTVGKDGFYYGIRDYDLLRSGRFGSVLWAQDNTTGKMFAIKQNKSESLTNEYGVLSQLAEHDHIVKFLGAVIDEGEPPVVYKTMMELAENGNLAEMLRDEDGLEAPLPQDQSLYYLQQILEGVNFLHQSGYLHLDIKAQNVLVFDDGRTVKLTDFGTAVAVDEVTSKRRLKGITPHFAAPEIVRGEVPNFSADIWSVLCILVEMLTARWPGCHQVVRNETAIMFLVGSYEDHMINDLISLDALDVDPKVKQLFIDVLRKDPQSRPRAIELLNRPIISSAIEYACYFDKCYDSEDAEDLEASPAADCDASVPIADVPQQISLTSSGGHSSLHSLGDKVGELPQIPCGVQLQRNRGSQDSGVGGDLENSIAGSNVAVCGSQVSQMSMRSSSSGSSRGGNQQILSHQGSGLDDSLMCGDCSQTSVCIPVHQMDMHVPSINPYSRQRSSSINKSGGFPSLTFSSLPQASTPQADYTMVQRSYSFVGRPATKWSDSSSRSQNRATSGLNHIAKRRHPNLIHPKLHHLTHSQSAPSIGFVGKRRHSLQHLDTYGTEEPWEADAEADRANLMGRSHLRRTSSEVYVDRGPDIDTPEKEKTGLQELLSGLNLGSTRPSRSSAPIPAQRQMNDAVIQCEIKSGSSTTSNELTLSDSTKHFDDSASDDCEDEPPSASGSFQQIC